jgi:heme exporter protein C
MAALLPHQGERPRGVSKMLKWLHQWGSPPYFYHRSKTLALWCGALAAVILAASLGWGLFVAPADYQQQDAFRIIYIHVPAALLSMAIYTYIAGCSIIYLVWKVKLADIIAKVSAPIGALFTVIALVTGALWGKPMWGTWWIWDARLTSELLLLFIYLGYIGLRSALQHNVRLQATVAAILALVGEINIPIIHYSVEWWHTLHQGPTISKFARPDIALEMLLPLLGAIVGFGLFYGFLVLIRASSEILWRERHNAWVREYCNER